MPPSDELPFHEALRLAIERRNLPLDRISAHLRSRGHAVSVGTLSYWQSGRSLPSRSTSIRALGALELILDVERGHLARRVPSSAGDDLTTPPLALADIEAQAAFVDEIFHEMGRKVDDTIRIVSAHWRSFNDEYGAVRYGHIREIIRARTHTDTYVASAWHPVAGQDVVITPLLGCTIRRMVTRAQYSVCVAELKLPPLARGALHAVEYEISYPSISDRVPFNRAVALFPAPVEEIVIEVNFPSQALPVGVDLIEGSIRDEEVRRTAVVQIHPTLTVSRVAFGPGRLGFEWQPPDAEVPGGCSAGDLG